MDLIVKFKDGEAVTLKEFDNWNQDLAGKKDIIELFNHYIEINKELTFTNPKSGFEVKRYAEDLKSIEFIF